MTYSTAPYRVPAISYFQRGIFLAPHRVCSTAPNQLHFLTRLTVWSIFFSLCPPHPLLYPPFVECKRLSQVPSNINSSFDNHSPNPPPTSPRPVPPDRAFFSNPHPEESWFISSYRTRPLTLTWLIWVFVPVAFSQSLISPEETQDKKSLFE